MLWAAAETGTVIVYRKIYEEEATKHDFQTAISDMGGPMKLGGHTRLKLSFTSSCLTSFTALKASRTDQHWRKAEQA